jgi:hypothetical protein
MPMQAVGEPGDAIARMVEHAGGETRLLDFAVAADDGADAAHVGRNAVGPERPAAEHERGVGGVVRDGVENGPRPLGFRIEALNARIENLECGRDVGGGIEHVVERAVGAGERARQHEGELGFDAQLQEAIGRDDGAVAMEHVVEQDAEVGLGDVDGALHGLGGQADLVAFDAAALPLLELHPRVLDGVGIVDGHAGIVERELAAGHARARGLFQALRGQGEHIGSQRLHACSSSRTSLRSTPTPETSTSTTSPG